MIGVRVVGTEQVAKNLSQFDADLQRTQERQVNAAAVLVQRKVRERMSDPGGHHPFWGRTGGSGDNLSARTGQSRAKVLATPAFRFGDTVMAQVGSPDRHIAHLEEGGTVSGKPFLRIPTGAAQTANGADRWAGRSIRDIPGAFLQRTMRGSLWAMRSIGRRVEFLYLLVHSVTHRGRHVFERSRQDAEPEIARNFGDAISTDVRRANGAG